MAKGKFASMDYSGMELECDSINVSSDSGIIINGTTVTATAAEINSLDGLTADVNELNILEGVTATASEINAACDVSARGEVVTTANTITAAESGKTFFLNSTTAIPSTLPAPAVGLEYEFVIRTAASSGAHTIVTNAATNTIYGAVATADGNASVLGSAEDTISLTTSAIVGDKVRIVCDGTLWYCDGLVSVAAGITFTAT